MTFHNYIGRAKVAFEEERGGATGSNITGSDLTRNDVTGSHVTGTGSHMTGNDRVRMRHRFPRFFLTIVVIQNVPLNKQKQARNDCSMTN
jgi:hypothetical protein